MKSNEAILTNCTAGANNQSIIWDDAIDAMKEAQVEAIKEVVKRYQDNFSSVIIEVTSVDKIAQELIKEIEG